MSPAVAGGSVVGPPGRPAWILRAVMVAVALAVTVVVINLIGRVDWAAVRDALGRLTWWQPLVLLALLVVRQVLNAVAYLFAYPFTLFPFSGLGIVDALILAALVESGGADVEATAVAGLIVWRVLTLAGPVLMGVAAVAHWRRTVAGTKA